MGVAKSQVAKSRSLEVSSLKVSKSQSLKVSKSQSLKVSKSQSLKVSKSQSLKEMIGDLFATLRLSRKRQWKRSTVLQPQSLRWFRRRNHEEKRDKTVQSQSIRNGELQIEYTGKPLSGWGGLSLIFEYFERIGFYDQLRGAIKKVKSSNNRVESFDVMLTFLATVLVGGSRFAHVQRVCHDEVVRRIVGAKRLGSEDTVRRFFLSLSASEAEELYTSLQRFSSALLLGHTQEDVLDLDSTILERYGQQEGVAKGYHSARAGQTSHHPLLAMLVRAKHIPLVWLRAGGASTLR